MRSIFCALIFALLALAPSCLAHTYFKADLVPFGNQEPDSPDASAHLTFFNHQGEIYWKLNLTDVEGAKAAKLIYGTPEVEGDEVVTLLDFGEAMDFNATTSFQGSFNASEFSDSYAAWSVNTLAANAGLNHMWAVVESAASWENTLLFAPLVHYAPAGEER